jgi:hypothetical protein
VTPSPIPRVLSALRRHRVKALLMGGQACILYGAAEFSRDVDVAVGVSPANLRRLRAALARLDAEQVFFPPLGPAALRRGHACHFRCRAPGLHGVRLDVMAAFRGSPPFHRLWSRRRRIRLPGVGSVSVMSLADLVTVKKTQRDKDWPMIRRLVEADLVVPTPPGWRSGFGSAGLQICSARSSAGTRPLRRRWPGTGPPCALPCNPILRAWTANWSGKRRVSARGIAATGSRCAANSRLAAYPALAGLTIMRS